MTPTRSTSAGLPSTTNVAAVVIRLACADTGQADQVAAAVAETRELSYTDGSGTVTLPVSDVTVEP